MRVLFGFLQVGMGVGGLIALFNGQWLWMILAWAGAFLVGFRGNRMTRSLNGVSDSAYESLANIPQAIDQIRAGNFQSAAGLSLGAVNSFRLGGDKALLPMALVVRAVALGGGGKFDQARKAADEAERLSTSQSRQHAELLAEMRPIILQVQRELSSARPDPRRLVSEFLAMNGDI